MSKEKKNEWGFKRFFSPVKDKPQLVIIPFLVSCLWVVFPLITVEIFKRATTSIQNWEYEWIKKWVFIYLRFVIVWIMLWYLLRNVDTITMNEVEKKIQWEYLKKYELVKCNQLFLDEFILGKL